MWGMGRPYPCRAFAAVALVALFTASVLHAETFRFGYTRGEKYRILSQVHESVYVNGRFAHDVDILNKIAVSVTDTRGRMLPLSKARTVSAKSSGV